LLLYELLIYKSIIISVKVRSLMCHSHEHGHPGGGCCGSSSGKITGFMQPWLLLLLSEKPAHGYQLSDKLNQKKDTAGIDPGFLYKTLRQFEEDGLVKSAWDTEGSGPARRVYQITKDGVEYLHRWAEHIRETRDRLGRFLESYSAHFNPDD
jgi:PadR family transcriptional regulator, regulatory protein PadR